MTEEKIDLVIEGNTATWEINTQGDILGLYSGQFRFRCYLTPSQRLSASRDYRELLGPNPSVALQTDDNLAFALSQLKHRILSSPPFWSSSLATTGIAGDLPDDVVIMKVLDASIEAELRFKAQVKDKRKDAIQRARKAAERLLNDREEDDKDKE